jgi:hypothetical protein
MQSDFEIFRAKKLAQLSVEKLGLDLENISVLTEAGSNYFIYTSLIAYYAGAQKIFVWIKDSPYGKAEDICNELLRILNVLNIERSVFDIKINERESRHIEQADIITNLGFIRPIDKNFIDQMKTSAVISYMCEAWEQRQEDVDAEYCKRKNIPVAGVWENHPALLIFNGCGPLSAKLCFEAGLEIYQNKILIVSSDKFGKAAAQTFSSIGAITTVIDPAEIIHTDLNAFDIVFVADYTYKEVIIGKNIEHKLEQLKNCAVVHLCGMVDYDLLKKNAVFCYPTENGRSFRMTRTLAHLGLKPVIDLHAAGLKVGECLFKKTSSDLVQPL